MKKKIILKRIFHRGDWRYAIVFDRDENLSQLVRSVEKVTWSQTNRCWYAGADEKTLKQILTVFRDKADIDISAIVSGEQQRPDSEPEPPKQETTKNITIPDDVPVIKAETTRKIISHSNRQGFSPVLFTISEPDGRLVIRFMGKYDKEWIQELNEFGRPYYDAGRKEWLLKWTQFTVDSLSDYFSSRDVEVIVKKREVTGELKELRDKVSFEVRHVERPRRGRALPKVFSKEEVMKIFNAARNSKHKLILWIIYSCGLRRSEVINIKLTDLDKDRGILHIREGKGNNDRMVPVPQKVWEKINTYIKGYNPVTYLFEGQAGGKYSVESVYSVFKQSLRRAGIKKEVGVHCLRHSYATHLHESGLDIRYIQELLGHKSTRTTEIYTHISRRNLFAIRSPIEDMELD